MLVKVLFALTYAFGNYASGRCLFESFISDKWILHVLFVISDRVHEVHKISMQHNVVYHINIHKIPNKFWMKHGHLCWNPVVKEDAAIRS